MASVSELRQALETEQSRAVELAERSFDAIGQINAQASFWISIISLGLAAIAIIGFGVIYAIMIRTSKRTAERIVERFIRSEDGKTFVRKAIQDEVKSQFQDKAFVVVQPLGVDEPVEPFPAPPINEQEASK